MHLYKYLHPDRVDVLRGGMIRFSSPRALNDPFELKPNILGIATPQFIKDGLAEMLPQALEEELSKIPAELRALIPKSILTQFVESQLQSSMPDILDQMQALAPRLRSQMETKFEELLGILCLSEHHDSLLMWAHYADCHRGFLVEFDPQSPFFDVRRSNDDDLRHLRKVQYSATRPSKHLVEIEDFSPFLTKGIEWAYEAEWRMTVALDCSTKILGGGQEAIHLFAFPATAVKSVILGCRVLPGTEEAIRECLSSDASYAHVDLYRAEVDQAEYKVNIRRADA